MVDLEMLVSLGATVFTIGLFCTNFVTLAEFRRQRTTHPKPYFPFLATFLNCTFWAKYGVLLGNWTILIVNGTGLVVLTYCMLVYYYYAESRRLVERHTLIAYVALLVYLILVKIYHTEQTAQLVGMTASTASMIMFGAPLTMLYGIVKSRDASAVSFPIAVMSLIVASLWAILGLQLSDMNIIVPNAVGAVLAAIQIALCLVFRRPAASG